MNTTRRLAFGRPRAKPHRLSVLEVKALVRHRDGYRCRECGMTARQHVRKHGRTLEVHRLQPGSRYTVRGCITVCRDCHYEMPVSDRWCGGVPGGPIYLPPEYHAHLSTLAARNKRPVAWELRIALERHFQENSLPPIPGGLLGEGE